MNKHNKHIKLNFIFSLFLLYFLYTHTEKNRYQRTVVHKRNSIYTEHFNTPNDVTEQILKFCRVF